jgi:uncharacterized protein YggE
MKLSIVTIAVLLMAVLCVAEDKPQMKTVRVTGTAEVKVVPDQALIELGVEKQNISASIARQAVDSASRRILAGLHANGVGEKDIQTTFLSLQPQFNYRKGMKISYFVAEQTMSVTVRDLSKLDTLLESLIKAGGNRIDSIQYETSDLRKYRDDARDRAVKAAREKARALAMALGQEIGKAQSVEEVPEAACQYYGYTSNASFELSKTPARSGPATAAGQRSISASVVVSFELN